MSMPTFSNPRLVAEFSDWPLGGNKRGPCKFEVEKNNKGCRILRTTTGRAKASTYSTLCAIVDGDDGKTYLLHYNGKHGNSVSIFQSDNQHNAHFGQSGDHYHPDTSPHYDTLKSLIDEANKD